MGTDMRVQWLKVTDHSISETAAGQNLACAKTISHGAERRFVPGQW